VKNFFFSLIWILGSSFLLLEIALRILPYGVRGEPLLSLLTESARISNTSGRLYSVGGKYVILLPEEKKTALLTVGDSFAFGHLVPTGSRYSDLLGRDLNRTSINMGLNGLAPLEYNRMLEIGARYHPDIVIYSVYMNDFNYESGTKVRLLSTDNTERFLEGDQNLVARRLTASDLVIHRLRQVINLSRAVKFKKFISFTMKGSGPIKATFANHFFAFLPTAFWDPMIDLQRPNVLHSLALNEGFIEEASAFCQRIDAKLLVVLIPDKEMTYATELPEIASQIHRPAYDEVYGRLADSLTKKGIATLNLTEPFRKKAHQGEKLFFSIDTHLNESGHRYTADLIKEKIAAYGW
jgi:hypothetical protein